jgi:hypothetical protein
VLMESQAALLESQHIGMRDSKGQEGDSCRNDLHGLTSPPRVLAAAALKLSMILMHALYTISRGAERSCSSQAASAAQPLTSEGAVAGHLQWDGVAGLLD